MFLNDVFNSHMFQYNVAKLWSLIFAIIRILKCCRGVLEGKLRKAIKVWWLFWRFNYFLAALDFLFSIKRGRLYVAFEE